MLTTIREKITGGVAVVILGLIALTFVFWGVDFGNSANAYALKVNGEEVPALQVQQAVRNQITGYQQQSEAPLTPQIEQRIRDNVVDRYINELLFNQQATELGYRVSDAAVAEEVRSLPYFQVDGRFDPATYDRLLAIQGQNKQSFEHQYRLALVRQQISRAVAQSGFSTPSELAQRAALENEEREVSYLQLSMNQYSDQVQPSDEQIRERYEAHPDRYQTRESATLEYLELTTEMVAEEVNVDEQAVREAYETDLEGGRFQTVEERKTSHILVSPGDDDDAAKAKAQGILERAQAGEDFAELARSLSDDTVSGAEGGDLGWVSQGMMVEPFNDALQEMTAGELRGPVKTDFGYHIISLQEIRGGDVQPYEEVRVELEQELKLREAENLFFERRELLAELTFENIDTLLPASDALGIEVQTVSGVNRAFGGGVAAQQRVRTAAFSTEVLAERRNSEVLELAPDQLVVVRVKDYQAAELKPLEQVRDSILSVLKLEGGREKVQEVGETLVSRIEAGESLSALAEEFEANYAEPQKVKRTGSEVPGEVLRAAFSAPAASGEHVRGVALMGGDYVIYKVADITPGAMPVGAELEALRQQRAAASGAMDFGAYANALREQAQVQLALDRLAPQEDPLAP